MIHAKGEKVAAPLKIDCLHGYVIADARRQGSNPGLMVQLS
jgi:hypothetical protein